jgi:hypothetical protein
MATDLLYRRNADISSCGLFRWRLERDNGRPGRTAVFCGVNPSKADAKVDDHTIVKLYGFGAPLNISRWIVVNEFAYRATEVDELKTAADPIGHFNDARIEQAFLDADLHIVGWGALAKLPNTLRTRWRDVVAIAERRGVELQCWGTSQDGHPRHPLMLAYSTPLVPWRPPQ